MKYNCANAGEGWPYDHRPMADQGRDIYHQHKDGQGSLVSLPEKERPVTEYERLLKGLYEAARRASAKTHAGVFISLREFMDALVDFDRAAVHQVEAGILHADQRGERGMFAPKLDAAKSTAKREAGQGESLVYRFHDGPVNQPQDHTAQPPFTQEEIATVRGMRQTSLEVTYEQMARRCREGRLVHAFTWKLSTEGYDYWCDVHGRAAHSETAIATALTDEARAKLLRYASIAEHLAKAEGE